MKTKKNYKICHISSVHPALDIRIFFKECKSLAAAGYDVTLIAVYNEEQTVDGVRIVPFRLYKNRFKRILFSPFRMLRLALRQHAAVYHFHDPELIPVGIMLKLFRKKVIYDVHEDVGRQVMYKHWIKSTLLKKIISAAVTLTEKTGALFFDRIVTVTTGIAAKFKPSKTILLRNMPVLEMISRAVPAPIKKEKPVIVYSGGLTRVRGIKQLVDAMKYVRDRAELWLLGKWESAAFARECEQSPGWAYTRHKGFLPQEEVFSMMKVSDIGVVTFLPLPNHIEALPNKPFEYMACNLPIVMSNFSSWQDIFNRCALFADPESPEDIARNFILLLEDKDLGARLAAAGAELIRTEYSWEAEKEHLLKMYNELLPIYSYGDAP